MTQFKKGNTIVAMKDTRYLTKGKKYEVINITSCNNPVIEDDVDEVWAYRRGLFKLVKKKRLRF